MDAAINLQEKLSLIKEHWSPRVIGEVENSYVKLAKLKESLDWHKHEDEDELFLVLDGHLRIELEDRPIGLTAGELYIVPKGVMHNPVADEECSVLLFEKKSTQHTGDLNIDQTHSLDEQLRPL